MPKEQHARSYGKSSLENQLAATKHAFEEFTYIVAHDLNAPLRRIVNFSQLLEMKYGEELDAKALHYVDLINENSHKAQARLAGLLQYSRLHTIPLKPELVECNNCIDHCLKQLKNEIDEREAQIHIHPLPRVVADNERLILLFKCLLQNALKFSRERPEIDVTAKRGHEAWVFSVHDNGIGITLKDHEAIFNIFHQLHNDSEYPGIGMGLTLVQKIVDLHDGIIWVDSLSGKGATFYFTLPDSPLSDSTA